MSPRQLLRLRESRKSDSFDDQKTPSQIEQAEILAANQQDFIEYLLSQVRQILGTEKWNDPVPTSLASGLLRCACTALETIGCLVHISGNAVGGFYTIRKTDPTNISHMPVIGMVVNKADTLHADVRYSGPISGIFSQDLEAGKPYFVGMSGELVLHPPGGEIYIQKVGVALDRTTFLLVPDTTFIHRVS